MYNFLLILIPYNLLFTKTQEEWRAVIGF